MLFESPDFEDAIKAAQNHFKNLGLTEQFTEKDYYVTEVLRIVARLERHALVLFGNIVNLTLHFQLYEPTSCRKYNDKICNKFLYLLDAAVKTQTIVPVFLLYRKYRKYRNFHHL